MRKKLRKKLRMKTLIPKSILSHPRQNAGPAG